jgi:DNA modification methylase
MIYNNDCFNVLGSLDSKSVDMVLVDLPYGQTDCKWDTEIDLKRMWQELKRCCKPGATLCFFTTVKYGNKLINSNERWFRYDLVWAKSKSVGFLCANIMPLRSHEMIYVFSDINTTVDDDNSRNLGLRAYARRVKAFINTPIKEIHKAAGAQCIDHFYRVNSTQFALPTKETYDKLIELYKLNEMEGFRTIEDLKREWVKIPQRKLIYNPQKTAGKPYKTKKEHKEIGIYGVIKRTSKISNGDRYPKSVLEFNGETGHHETQKPSKLCEWLIKTYSNENDTVLDFTMGSGTTGIACLRTKRNFIGIEKDEAIFKTARNRLIQEELDLLAVPNC